MRRSQMICDGTQGKKLHFKNEDDTARFAREIFREIRGGKSALSGISIGLIGGLGTGKTTFVKYFAEEAGVSREKVSSPSFVLQHLYSGPDVSIEHWDLYRLTEPPDELFEEVRPGVIRLVEWVDNSPLLLGQQDILIRFEFQDLEDHPEERVAAVDYKPGHC